MICDREITVYSVNSAVLDYKTAVVRGDFDLANRTLPLIPEHCATDLGKFLATQGFKEEALLVTKDNDHKFELALQLGKLEVLFCS